MISEIQILRRTGYADQLFLIYTFKSGVWPFTESAYSVMSVACGCGEDYVKLNFPGVPYSLTEVAQASNPGWTASRLATVPPDEEPDQ